MIKLFKRLLPRQERRLTWATILTLFRFALVPLIVGLMTVQSWATAGLLCGVAATTDAIDGYIARRLNEQTVLGAALDPLADKALVLSVLTTLCVVDHPPLQVPRWFVFFLLSKELLQLIGAVLLWLYKGSLAIQPTWLAKMTALIQMVFIIWLLACYNFGWLPLRTSYATIATLVILQIGVFVQYAYIGVVSIKESR